ncbi:Kinesin motor domain protein [Paragonimus heterotremus]|uniref:Kinesin motor domain protein n=1 Tax=Paragonimus heterotremus TaxID=100268 RepID=A0A8J4TEA0_9TREM|nr:Kinesin motor domain protein [Paragonimus heterotremus]
MEGFHDYLDSSSRTCSQTNVTAATYRLNTQPQCPELRGKLSKTAGAPIIDKKPPTAFLDTEDWGLYLRVCCQIQQIKAKYGCAEEEAEQMIHSERSGRGSRLIRLICAFNRLYVEYSKLVGYASRKLINASPSQKNLTENIGSPKIFAETGEVGSKTFDIIDPVCQSGCVHNSSGCGDTGTLAVEDASTIAGNTQTSPVVGDQTRSLELDCNSKYRSCASRCLQDKAKPNTRSGTVFSSSSTSVGVNLSNRTSRSTQAELNSLLSSRGSRRQPTLICFRWCCRFTRKLTSPNLSRHAQEALKLSKQLETSVNFSNEHKFSEESSQEYFDQIRRDPVENSVVVYQLVSYQWRIEHRTQLPKESIKAFHLEQQPSGKKLMDVVQLENDILPTIRLPIALELILPKMQNQIKNIMCNCKYLYDPLEVAAELRHMNYDTEACIAYFHKTRPLREVIHEFLPKNHITKTDANLYPHNQPPANLKSQSTLHLDKITFQKFLLNLKTQLIALRTAQQDATRHLNRLRQFSLGMNAQLGQALEEMLISQLCLSPQFEKIISTNRTDLPFAQLSKLVQENRSLKMTLRMEENRRKTMFNMMQEYLGNIRVYCRCRAIPHTRSCIEVPTLDTVLFANGTEAGIEQYKFDRVFDCHATQAEIYTELAPSVCSFLDGYNVCFLTYGGEASGKTYTLLGAGGGGGECPHETNGIVYRALCNALAERDARQHDWDYCLTVAVIEIYNDNVTDMLGNETGVNLHVDSGLERMMDALSTLPIEMETDIEDLLNLCRAKRRIGHTALNSQSSRSHLIILTRLNAESRIHETKFCSILALCDLAGFEDIIKADTLGDPILAKEAGYINRSLTALNRVFMSLRTQDPNTVSYRDSKLTYLLKPFFTFSGNLASTQSSLRFGRESRGVTLGRARRQLNLDRLLNDTTLT